MRLVELFDQIVEDHLPIVSREGLFKFELVNWELLKYQQCDTFELAARAHTP